MISIVYKRTDGGLKILSLRGGPNTLIKLSFFSYRKLSVTVHVNIKFYIGIILELFLYSCLAIDIADKI